MSSSHVNVLSSQSRKSDFYDKVEELNKINNITIHGKTNVDGSPKTIGNFLAEHEYPNAFESLTQSVKDVLQIMEENPEKAEQYLQYATPESHNSNLFNNVLEQLRDKAKTPGYGNFISLANALDIIHKFANDSEYIKKEFPMDESMEKQFASAIKRITSHHIENVRTQIQEKMIDTSLKR